VALSRQGVQPDGAEEAERRFVAAPVLEGARTRERGIAIDTETDLAQPRLDRERRALDDGDAPSAPENLRPRVLGIDAELSTESKEVRRDPIEDALAGPRVREQPVNVRGSQTSVGDGARRGLRFEMPRGPALDLPELRVAHTCDDSPAHHPGPAGMRCLAMISRITSLVPAPIPQFCTPREQRAT